MFTKDIFIRKNVSTRIQMDRRAQIMI